jgi:uncharacterized iron-regulated membrane protein
MDLKCNLSVNDSMDMTTPTNFDGGVDALPLLPIHANQAKRAQRGSPLWVWGSAILFMLGVAMTLASPLRALGQATASKATSYRPMQPVDTALHAVPEIKPAPVPTHANKPLNPAGSITPATPNTANTVQDQRKEGRLSEEQRQQLRQQVIDASKHNKSGKQVKKTG